MRFRFGKYVIGKVISRIDRYGKTCHNFISFLSMKSAVSEGLYAPDRKIPTYICPGGQTWHHYSCDVHKGSDIEILQITDFCNVRSTADVIFLMEIPSQVIILFFRVIHDRIINLSSFNVDPTNAIRILFMEFQKSGIDIHLVRILRIL